MGKRFSNHEDDTPREDTVSESESFRKILCRWQRNWKTVLLGGTQFFAFKLTKTVSGDLLFAREAHYQTLTQIAFTSDEMLVFSGGEDALVHTWRLFDLVKFDQRSEEIMPVQTWNDHSLPITGIFCGQGMAMNSRLYTSSLDQTVKVRLFHTYVKSDLGCGCFTIDDNDIIP
jgi:WD40 repeat protein